MSSRKYAMVIFVSVIIVVMRMSQLSRSIIKNESEYGNSGEQSGEIHLEYEDDGNVETAKEAFGEENITNVEAHSKYAYYDDEGELATQLLKSRGHIETRHQVLRFRPGTLDMTSSEALQHCYCDTKVYNAQLHNRTRISVSSKYKLVYVMVGKSGSSTARAIMKNIFNSKEVVVRDIAIDDLWGGSTNVTAFTFIRDPLSRFFSGYDEAFKRTAPWRKEKGLKQHAAPYLHQGLKSRRDYHDLFCPPEVLIEYKMDSCNHTYENGTLSARLERFVSEYDGLSPFNGHLELQVPKFTNSKTGIPFHIDEIYNTAASKEGWNILVQNYGLNLSHSFANKRANSRYRKFDINRISNDTKQRICNLAMLDYCCLNLPLPEPCSNLYCKLSRSHDRTDGIWQIEPWNFPHK